jgi:peptide/nickel transport system permease protein
MAIRSISEDSAVAPVGHRWRDRIRALRPMERFGLIAVGVLLVLAVIGPEIAPFPTITADPANRLQPPNGTHWFGTDENGMDILSRILASPRVDVSVAFISIGIAVVVGTVLGVFAGFFEGSRRRAASLLGETILRLLDVIQAFPVFILAMVLVAIRGASTENIIIAIAFVNMPVFLRISRAEILSLRERPFAEAAQSIGATDKSVAFRHLLPNAFPPIIAQISATMGFAILLTAGLSFVGAGVSPPTPELGSMISTGAHSMIIGLWWPSLFPGIALGIVVFSFAAAGEALAHLLEPHSADAERASARADGSMQLGAGVGASIGAATSVVADVDTSHAVPVEDVNGQAGTSPARTIVADSRAPELEPSGTDVTHDHGLSRPAECLLEVDGLTVEFGASGHATRVLQDVSLWVAPGEALGVVGEAASGKSVAVLAMLRLLPDGARVVQGSVRYRGEDLLTMDPERLRRMRAVEFSPILPNAKEQLSPVSRIEDLMVLVYRTHTRCSRREAVAKSVEALRSVGIQDPERRLRAYPHELSGGMAQRVCIAMSLLQSPRLLIADEPTAGLDVTVQRQVLDQLVAAARDRQAAQLIVTRDLGIVAQYCQRVAVMERGRIVETGPTTEVFHRPRHDYTRRLLEAVGVQHQQQPHTVAHLPTPTPSTA